MRILTFFLLLLSISATAFAQQDTGTTAQNFVVNTIENESIELEEMKGKIVVMTFWSTRCPICAAEIPDLNKLAAKHNDESVVFLGLAWQDKAKLDVFLKKKPFDFKIVPQSFGVLLKYADRTPTGRLNMGFPSHFIVDQNGIVVYKASGFDRISELGSTIDRLLGEGVGVE